METQNELGSFRDLLLVVIRQRRAIAAVYVALVVTALAGIVLLPPQYRAGARILITANRASISTSPDKTTELVRSGQLPDAELNAQLEVLRSRELVRQAFDNIRPEEKPVKPGLLSRVVSAVVRFPGAVGSAVYRRLHHVESNPEDDARYEEISRIRDATETERVKNSNLIEIAFRGPDPLWARDFVNRLTAAYLDRYAQMQQAMGAQDFFTRQSELLRQKLADSEVALRSQREKAGTLAGQQQELHQRLNEFVAELARTKIARVEQERRVAFLEGLQSGAHQGRIATPQLLELEGKRATLIGRYRPDSERVKEIDDQIRALRSAMSAYDAVSAEPGSAAAGTDLISTRAALAALKGKEEALGRESEEYRRQAELLDAQNFDLVRLERQVKLDEEAYLSYVRTAEESRLSTALEQSKILRLTIVEPAAVPMEPVSPKKGLILGVALIGGLMVSLGIGFARDYLDTTLKTPGDVRRFGNIEVLAVLRPRGRAA